MKQKLKSKGSQQITKTAAKSAAVVLMGLLSTNAMAAITIDFKSEFAKPLSENKAGDAAQAIADQAVNLGGVVDILKNWESYTPAQRIQALNQIPVLTTGSTYSVYTSNDSAVGGTTANGPTVRIGAGSIIPTRVEGGRTVLDAEDVASGTFGGVTTNYAGNETYGSVSIGNNQTGEYRTLQNVAAGRVTATSTDGINGSQLYAAQQGINKAATDITNLTTKVNQGFNVAGTTGTDNIQLGETLTINGANNNIKTAVTNGRVALDLGNDINVPNSVTVGPVSLHKDNGINAGNKKITNVAPATLSPTSTEAVNGSQLDATNKNVTNLTTKVDEGFNISDGKTNDNVKLGQTITYAADANTKVAVTDNKVTIGLADNVNVAGNITAGGTIRTGNVSMSPTGFNAGNTKIVNVADGLISQDSTEAINGSQLYELKNQIGNTSTSWTITDGVNRDTMNGGETLTYRKGSDNVKVNVADNQVTFDLGDNIAVTGNISSGGVISTGPVSMSKDGIIGGNKKITNVAPATLSPTSTDVVIGSQLDATNKNVTNLTNTVNQGFNVTDGTNTDNIKLGETIEYTTDGNTKVTVKDNELEIGLADSISIRNDIAAGGTIRTGNVSMSATGFNAGDLRIKNVAAGEVSEKSTDAINGSQLYALQNRVNQGSNWTISNGTTDDRMNSGEKLVYTGDSDNIKVSIADNRVGFDLGSDLNVANKVQTGTVYISKDGISGGDKKITNVAPATISSTSKDAVIGSQLYTTNQKLDTTTNKVNQGFNVAGNSGETNVQLGSTVTIAGTDGNIQSVVTDGKVGLALSDNVKINNQISVGTKGITINDNGLDVKNTKITNVAAGELSSTSTDAINGSQLYNFSTEVNRKLGDVVYYDSPDHTSVTFGGINSTKPVTLKNVAPGKLSADSTEVVNGSQLYETNANVTNVTNTVNRGYTFTADKGSQNYKLGANINLKGDGNIVTEITNGTINVGLADDIKVKGNVTIGGTVYMDGDKITGVGKGDINENSTDVVTGSQLHETNQNVTRLTQHVNKGWDLADDKGNVTNVQLGKQVKLSNTDGNVDITVKDGAATVNLSDKVKVGEVKVGDHVTINQDGINVGGTRITGVAPGEKGTDAVNVNQLNTAVTGLNNRIDQVEDDAKAGTAAAIAVASLGQAWEYGRSAVSVAGSAYDGKAGWAIGGSHITDNGRWLVKYNASGSDNNKYGFGVSGTYQY